MKHRMTDIQLAALVLREQDPGGTLPDDLLAYEQARNAALAQLAAVTQQRDALREALEAVEFAVEYRSRLDGHVYCQCPKCGEEKPDHRPGCQLAAALAQVRS